MDWPNFQYDQDNLPLLCQDWPVDAAEYHAQNSLYGFNWYLKQYAKLPESEPLPWAIEHAISFDNPDPYFAESESCLPVIFAITEAQAEILRKQVDVRVEPIGSAFFYMERVFRNRHPDLLDRDGNRRGTLVFPDKSTRNQDTDYDRASFARQLAELPEEYQPVYVSIFWRDYERGTHLPFVEAGLKLVSSGNPYDPEFLIRQLDLCRQFKYACANDLSTSFCLSVLGGCQFFFCPTGPLTMTRSGKTVEYSEEPTLHLPEKQRCIGASPFPPIDNRREQQELAARFAGAASVRDSDFFRDLAREGHRLMREMVPDSISLGLVQSLDHLAQWMPRAIDNDGWAQARSGFVIPGRDGFSGVRLRLEIPLRPDPRWEADWMITADGTDTYAFRAQPGTVEIEIPTRKSGARRTVFIESSEPIPLQKEARKRCFRVTGIEWIGALSGEPFSWGIKLGTGGERTPVTSPENLEINEDSFFLADRSSWQMADIDKNGWCHERFSLTIPRREGQAGARIKLHIRPPDDASLRARIAVRASGSKEVISDIEDGTWYLEIPTPVKSTATRVSLRWISPIDSISSEDSPNFRIQRIEWKPKLALGLKPEDPRHLRLRRLEELKELSQKPAPKPIWKRLLFRK